MAKKRKRRRRTSLITKALNALTIYIGLQPLLEQLLMGRVAFIPKLYSAGLSEGKFDQNLAFKAYGPIVAAILFRKGVSMLRKIAHV